jgi:hypothetical protein
MRYIIDRKTNEHERYDGQNYDATKYRIVETDSEGWIAHTGTVCPLPDDVRCDLKLADGFVNTGVRAQTCWWHYVGHHSIVAYRPILTKKVQEPDYDPRSVSFNLLDCLKAAHEHAQQIPDLEAELREVLEGMGYGLVRRSPFTQQRHGAKGE